MIHCLIDEMIADYYTKPLQGSQFMKLRSIIMGHQSLPIEERVIKETIENDTVTEKEFFKDNGNDREDILEKPASSKNGSILYDEVRNAKLVSEFAKPDEPRNIIQKVRKKVTYADMLLKNISQNVRSNNGSVICN